MEMYLERTKDEQSWLFWSLLLLRVQMNSGNKFQVSSLENVPGVSTREAPHSDQIFSRSKEGKRGYNCVHVKSYRDCFSANGIFASFIFASNLPELVQMETGSSP